MSRWVDQLDRISELEPSAFETIEEAQALVLAAADPGATLTTIGADMGFQAIGGMPG